MNKELVVREYLALERTRLANERTLLAYIRTGLYFLVAGSSLGQLIDTSFWRLMGWPFVAIGLLIILLGVLRFTRVKKGILESQANIGSASDVFIKSVTGRTSQ